MGGGGHIAPFDTPYPAKYPSLNRYHDIYGNKVGYTIKDGLIYEVFMDGSEVLYNILTSIDNAREWCFGNIFAGDNNDTIYEKVSFINGRVWYRSYSNDGGYIISNTYFNSDNWKNQNGGYGNNYLTGGSPIGYHPYHLAKHLKIIDGYICNLDGSKYTGNHIFKKWDE